MISFLLCLAILIVGYFVYGKIVDNTFGPDDRETPAVRINDGVDYVVMPQWKLFLVQLLNIAGLGPIFGAMQGALWGPVVFLWMYLFKEKKNYWITAVPATFMSAVSSTYFILAPECLGGLLNSKTAEGATIYNTAVAYPIGVIFAIAMLAVFLHATKKAAQKA